MPKRVEILLCKVRILTAMQNLRDKKRELATSTKQH